MRKAEISRLGQVARLTSLRALRSPAKSTNDSVLECDGLGSSNRRAVVKKVIRQCRASIILIQETKICSLNDDLTRQTIGSRFFKWVGLSAVGSSAGILLL